MKVSAPPGQARASGSTGTGTAAGGDLSGALPSPTVSGIGSIAISGTPAIGDTLVFDGTNWTYETPTLPEDIAGAVGPLLIADDHSTPIIFGDLLLTEEQDDLLYADVG